MNIGKLGITAALIASTALTYASTSLEDEANRLLGEDVTEAWGNERYEVFNAQDKDGWIIIDANGKEIAKGENGNLQEGDLPPFMQLMLDNYKPSDSTSVSFRASLDLSDINPLVQTKWDQGYPYKTTCPMITAQETSRPYRCPTGCGATALAQILYYHHIENLPAVGAYTIAEESNYYGTFPEFTVPALSASTLNYDLLKRTYLPADSTNEYGLEVAKLMRHCGQSINMQYGPKASSSTLRDGTNALKEVYGLSNSLKSVYRTDYSASSWLQMLHDEIAAGRPVILRGSSNSGSGHAFIADGFRGGKIHINWGWGGVGDGFFSMTALDPDDVTSVSNNLTDGYNNQMAAIIGIQKGEGQPSSDDYFSIIRLEVSDNTYTISPSNKIKCTAYGSNLTGKLLNNLELGFALYDSNDQMVYEKHVVTDVQSDFDCYERLTFYDFCSGVSNGEYKMHFVYKKDGEWKRVSYCNMPGKYIKVVVNNGVVTFETEKNYTLKSHQILGPTKTTDFLPANRPFTALLNIKNEGGSIYDVAYIYLNGQSNPSGLNIIEIDPEEEGVVPITFSTKVVGENTYKIVIGETTLAEGTFTASANQDASLTMTSSANYVKENSENVLHSPTLQIDITAQNTGSTTYNDVIEIRIGRYLNYPTMTTFQYENSAEVATSIPAGQSKTYHFEVPDLIDGNYYIVKAYYLKLNSSGNATFQAVNLGNTTFKVSDANATSVDETENSAILNGDNDVYDISGRKVNKNALVKGKVYVTGNEKFIFK